MASSVRTRLNAGVAAAAATALVLPAVAQSAPRAVTADRVAVVSDAPARAFAVRLLGAVEQLQHATAPSPTPVAATQIPSLTTKTTPRALAATASPEPAAASIAQTLGSIGGNLQNAIINGYNTILPWINWGVSTAQWAVGWVPWVGWVASDQIGIFYYSLISPMITSGVYNTAYVIGGTIGLGAGISNFINDTGNAIRGFVQAEVNWALSFLPPLPPLPFAATKAAAAKPTAATKTKAPLAASGTKGAAPATSDPKSTTDVKTTTDPKTNTDPKTTTDVKTTTDPKTTTDTQTTKAKKQPKAAAKPTATAATGSSQSSDDPQPNNANANANVKADKGTKQSSKSGKGGGAKKSTGSGGHAAK
ncbi:hypothetical protein ABIA30_002690 [Mycobacterium sp. MAA66]|uniref:hypothetical protein n=1 Tax=Mycobacterium sp. MAA66 TaxID=3156297 RepID=UPI0035176EFC